jgi:hypothetical protein
VVPGGLAEGATDSVWFAGTYVYPGDNTATVDVTSLVAEGDETNNTHTKAPPIPTLPLPCTPTPIPTKQPDPGDTDGDGCSDQQENGPDPMLGGDRDYLNFWDFFDTPGGGNVRDKQISGLDFFGLLGRFNATGNASIDPLSSPAPAPIYHTAFDRGPWTGPNPWSAYAPADGSIAGTDFFAMLAQFGHSCA